MSRIRPFEDRDYERYISVANRSFPEYGWTVDEARHEDGTWTDPKYFKERFVVEDGGDGVVGVLDLQHQRNSFDPKRYRCDIAVDPDRRRRGHGTALFEHALRLIGDRGGQLLVGSTKESMAESISFLATRGCVERQRAWESRLDVGAFDFARFAGAEERAEKQGIRITTLGAELATDRQAALRKAFALDEACKVDIPSVDPWTEGSFAVFEKYVGSPSAIPDAYFLAVKDGEYVGVSNMWKDLSNPSNLYQGLTGVHPKWRGKGIAMALKLRTVRYALENGIQEIRTWNSTLNRPMLRINEAMGFAKQPVWIEFEKRI